MNFLQFSDEMSELLDIETIAEELRQIFKEDYHEYGWVDDDVEDEDIQGLFKVAIKNHAPEQVIETLETQFWVQEEVDDLSIEEYIPILLCSGNRGIFVIPEPEVVEGDMATCLYLDAHRIRDSFDSDYEDES